MPTFQVEIDGTTHEVSSENVTLPKGYLTPDEIRQNYVPKDNVKATVTKRLKSVEKNMREQLLDDETFIREVFERYDVPLDDEGRYAPPEGGTFSEEDVEARLALLKKRMEKDHEKTLTQSAERLADLERREKDLLEEAFVAANERAARKAGVRDDHFAVLPGMQASRAAIHGIRQLFEYDYEARQWARKDGDVFVPSGSSSKVHQDMDDYWTEFRDEADEPTLKTWFAKEQRPGRGTDTRPGTNGAERTAVVTRRTFDEMNQHDRKAFALEGGKIVD